jgi:hypothetical protein
MPLPVPRGLQRVHRVNDIPRGDQRHHPRAAVGLDPDRHLRVPGIAQVPADQLVQLGHRGHPSGSRFFASTVPCSSIISTSWWSGRTGGLPRRFPLRTARATFAAGVDSRRCGAAARRPGSTGADEPDRNPVATASPYDASLPGGALRRHSPKVGAQCGSPARWDLCEGPPARAVPTATPADAHLQVLRSPAVSVTGTAAGSGIRRLPGRSRRRDSRPGHAMITSADARAAQWPHARHPVLYPQLGSLRSGVPDERNPDTCVCMYRKPRGPGLFPGRRPHRPSASRRAGLAPRPFG